MKRFLILCLGCLPCLPLLAQSTDYFGSQGKPAGSHPPVPVPPSATPAPALKPLEPQIATVEERFKTAMATLDKQEALRLGPVKTAALKELAKLRAAAQSEGNLNKVSDIDDLIKEVQTGATPPPPKVEDSFVQRARESYEFNAAPTLKQFGEQRDRLGADYTKAMADLQASFSQAFNLEAAEQARAARLNPPPGFAVDVLPTMEGTRVDQGGFAVVKDRIATKASFQPPLEIDYTLMVDSQVRLQYAADQIIFDWEMNRSELRIDGGPADGQHRSNAGRIPTKQLVQIRQVVLPNKMTVFVDGRERASWDGDFSGVNQPIALRSVDGAISVKQITAKKL